MAADVEAVVIWAKASDSGRIVRQLRDRGLSQPLFGTSRMASQEFLDLAGGAAEGVVAALWRDPAQEHREWLDFRERFRARHGHEPDDFAVYGFDAASLTIAAIRQAGLNRARIRDALTAVRSYPGVAGVLRFDATSNNISPPLLASVRGGRFVVD